ncbi:hypothetical protein [Rhizobium leguminosarum]|uniref:hypothetical protein n=1 Tax=Rhizobium leguminosarum TaxID=384 RepID=UPI0003F9D35E|nr:hypothetical protein [Rhizobium leguminosarum]NEH46120.1 hypothetical protein [Rhizobium leguminosarum]
MPIPDPITASAVAWMENYQLHQYRRLGIEPAIFTGIDETILNRSIEEISSSFGVKPESLRNELNTTLKQGSASPGSRYDSPLFRGQLSEVAMGLERWLLKPLSASPLLGELPRASPNALVVFHRGSGRHIIFFQRGQQRFFARAMGALAHACSLRNPFGQYDVSKLRAVEDWSLPENIYDRSFPWMLEAVLEAATGDGVSARAIVDEVCTPNRGTHFRHYVLNVEEKKIAYVLEDCVHAFVLGHEYGHIVGPDSYKALGHFGSLPELSEREFDDFLMSMVDEGFADEVGVGLSMRRNSVEGHGPEESYLGITLFFDLIDFLKNCVDVLKYGKIAGEDVLDSLTHPPSSTRRKAAEAVIARTNGSPLDTERGAAIAASFRELISYFWILAKPLFEQWHSRGLSDELAPEYR